MTERQAWYTMAVAYYTLYMERTRGQRRLTSFGLCQALVWSGITDKVFIQMRRTIKMSMPSWRVHGELGMWFCEYSPANDVLRADFCWFQYCRLGGK